MSDQIPAGEDPTLTQRRLSMLDFHLNHRGVLRAAEEVASYFQSCPGIATEYRDLAVVLREGVPLASDYYPVAGWPIALHRHYQRREIVAAVGFVEPGAKGKVPQARLAALSSGLAWT